MNIRLWTWRVITICLMLATLTGCASPATPQTTSTPVISGNAAGGAGSSDAGGSNSNSGSNTPTPQSTPTPESTPTPQSTPTLDPTVVPVGPYVVRQTMTLADEKLETPDGGVCLNSIWRIPANTPKVSMLFVFDPHGVSSSGQAGNTFGYAYQIPDAGEAHHAEGNYTLTPNPDGSLRVSITASDHVTFKGFDGVMPIHYGFDLVPMGGDTTCEGRQGG